MSVEQNIKEKGSDVFLKMVNKVISDSDKELMIELLIMLKESATFSSCTLNLYNYVLRFY